MERDKTTSLAKTEANRRNAQKSTGPRTAKGKAIVAQNALRHGLLAKEVRLPDEDEGQLVELGKRLRNALSPVGEVENLLVDRVIAAFWRLRRTLAVEVGVFQKERRNYLDKDEGVGGAFINAARHDDTFSKFCRYEAHIERGMYRALHELQRLQAARSGDKVSPPAVLDVNVSQDGS